MAKQSTCKSIYSESTFKDKIKKIALHTAIIWPMMKLYLIMTFIHLLAIIRMHTQYILQGSIHIEIYI